MIDFTPSQLTWIVIGACGIGGTGYLSIDAKFTELDKKVQVISVSADNSKEKLSDLKAQLSRIEEKLDRTNPIYRNDKGIHP